jgi:hypothetical protein
MARIFDHRWLMAGVAKELKRVSLTGVLDGTSKTKLYQDACTAVHSLSGSVLVFTRDQGMHSCGWWKNPDFEQCWHLSLSFKDVETGEPTGERNVIWSEPPFDPIAKKLDVWHYRLFCDEFWQPIKPRGEVYTKEFTEKGWKSFSEVQADMQAKLNLQMEQMQ